MTDLLTKNLAFLLKGDRRAQTAIAEKIGVSQPTISKWSTLHVSRSTSEPGFRNMAQLGKGLGVSLDDLAFRDLEDEGPSAPSQPERLNDSIMAQGVELLYLLSDARPEDKRFKRPTWAMIQIAGKAVQRAKGDPRKAMAEILAELAREYEHDTGSG